MCRPPPTNHNLEAMAKQLYDYWFVQFDFPNAEGKPYKSSGGKMVCNERLRRELPEGWEVCELSSVGEIKSGFPFKSEDYISNGEFGIITIKNVQDHHLDLSSFETIKEKPQRLPSYCELQEGDCLISLTGNVGRVCRVTTNNLLLNQRVGKVEAKGCSPQWVYQLYDDPAIAKQIQMLANGCAQANVSPIDIGHILVPMASTDILQKFEEKVNVIYQEYLANEKQIIGLSKLRDELLPLLMNGQVSVNYDLTHD